MLLANEQNNYFSDICIFQRDHSDKEKGIPPNKKNKIIVSLVSMVRT